MTREELEEFVLENFAAFSRAMMGDNRNEAMELAKQGAEMVRSVLGTEGALRFIEEYDNEKFVAYAKRRNNPN